MQQTFGGTVPAAGSAFGPTARPQPCIVIFFWPVQNAPPTSKTGCPHCFERNVTALDGWTPRAWCKGMCGCHVTSSSHLANIYLIFSTATYICNYKRDSTRSSVGVYRLLCVCLPKPVGELRCMKPTGRIDRVVDRAARWWVAQRRVISTPVPAGATMRPMISLLTELRNLYSKEQSTMLTSKSNSIAVPLSTRFK